VQQFTSVYTTRSNKNWYICSVWLFGS